MATKPFYCYLPVGEEELKWGLYVTTIGYHEISPGEEFPPKDHPSSYRFLPSDGRVLSEYQLIWIIEGEGTFSSMETGTISLSAGSAFMLFPGVWHTYRPNLATGWKDYWIGFNGSYIFEMCRRELFTPKHPLFRPRDTRVLTCIYDGLLQEIGRNTSTNSFRYSADVLKILATAREEPVVESPARTEGREQIVQEAVRIIWGWSYRALSVDDLAMNVQVNRRTLERYFREVLGTSILDEIVRCRLTRAKQLLENTRIPLQNIPDMAGFSSPQQMRRIFREMLGISPEKYRHQHRD